jgi:uncharacterized protein YecE (DUF72 family)
MDVRVGTSGFSYDEWRGTFYPEGITGGKMLEYYATQLPCVEINNTFYRMPKQEVVGAWAAAVPAGFRFAVKAPRRITHLERLRGAEESLGFFVKAASGFGDKLGTVLFQLPPFLRKDVVLLGEFLAQLPADLCAAFEFRHVSWFADDVFETLRARDAALCVGDAEKSERSPPLVATARWGYLRLRADDYSQEALADWAKRISAQPWSHAYAFLKHEIRGPALAAGLLAQLRGTAADTGGSPGPAS